MSTTFTTKETEIQMKACGQNIVVKLGGNIMQSQQNLDNVAAQIATLWKSGHQITVVHGGGPQINEYLKTQGVVPEFCCGWRITDTQTLMAVFAALGEVNATIVKALHNAGVPAAGLHAEPNFLSCKKKQGVTSKGESVDLGWVGDITAVNISCLKRYEGSVCVVSPLGWDAFQNKYNINADHVAFALAQATSADRLVFMSDVPGVLSNKADSTSVVPTLTPDGIQEMIGSGKVTEGMIPKLLNSLASAAAGVKAVSIISGVGGNALVNLVKGDGHAGTTVTANHDTEVRSRSLASAGAA